MSLLLSIQTKSRARFLTVLAAISLSLFFVACDSWTRYRRIMASVGGIEGTTLPAVDPTSPTGYEMGMRRLILPSQVGADGYHWIMHTQKMLANGEWRIRFTDIDNSPDGREIHWSHGLVWWLTALGAIHSSVSELPLPASIEAVAPYANTLLLAFLIVSIPWVVLRRLGPIAASGLALGLGGIYMFYEFFMVGNLDHHGIAAASAMICSLLLAAGGAGWVANTATNPPHPKSSAKKQLFPYVIDPTSARRFFIGSAAAGASSLWISAATAIPTFFGIGLGVLISAYFFGRSGASNETQYDPSLWRIWGLAGCIGSFCFYLLEYFPAYMGMRLEVNHPLYSLAWLGAGEILSRLTRWRIDGTKPWQGTMALPRLVLVIFLVMLLPALIGLFPSRFFWVSDHFLWNFHKDYIQEFRTFSSMLRGRALILTLFNIGIIPLLMAVIVRVLWLSELGPSWKGMLTLVLMPALLLTAFGFFQVRWLGIANSLWIATIPVLLGCICSVGLPHRFSIWEKSAGGCVACFIFLLYPQHTVLEAIAGLGRPASLGAQEVFGIYVRDLAYSLRRTSMDRDIVVVSGPTTTTHLMYFGGMRGIGTLYWENLPGLKATAEIYSARSELEALELVKQHRVTHIAILKSDAFAYEYVRLFRDLPRDAEPNDAFITSLISSPELPVWLNPIFLRPRVQIADEWLVLLEAKTEQTIPQAHFAMSVFHESRGERDEALNELLKAIELDPEYQDAWFRIGSMQPLNDDAVHVKESLRIGLKEKTPIQASELCDRLAKSFAAVSRHVEAAFFYRRALESQPQQPEMINDLAWLLATSDNQSVRNPALALTLAKENAANSNKVIYLDTLSAAYAANGDLDAAIVTVKRAIELLNSLAPDTSNPPADLLTEHLRNYESGSPIRFSAK